MHLPLREYQAPARRPPGGIPTPVPTTLPTPPGQRLQHAIAIASFAAARPGSLALCVSLSLSLSGKRVMPRGEGDRLLVLAPPAPWSRAVAMALCVKICKVATLLLRMDPILACPRSARATSSAVTQRGCAAALAAGARRVAKGLHALDTGWVGGGEGRKIKSRKSPRG